jgi:hypothetical protein
MFIGPVLTCYHDFDQIQIIKQRGGYNAIKVVTGWGKYKQPWTNGDRLQLSLSFDELIVRTMYGDPSLGDDYRLPTTNEVLEEIKPWYHSNPYIFVELGNEPNIYNNADHFWEYRWWLIETIQKMRIFMPEVRIIVPFPSLMHPGADPYLEITRDALKQGDILGLHAYEYHSFLVPVTRSVQQLENILLTFAGMDYMYTELGIHNPKMSAYAKGYEYGRLSKYLKEKNCMGVFYYHVDTSLVIHPEYHISAQGDLGFSHAYHGMKEGENL